MAQILSSGMWLVVPPTNARVNPVTAVRAGGASTDELEWASMDSIGKPAFRYRLYVAGSNVTDLVAIAGGWLFDRATAGWDVTAFVVGDPDGLPLQILGVETVKFRSARHFRDQDAPHTLAVAPALYERNGRLRAQVSRAIALGEPEVIFLGESHPPELPTNRTKVEHQCSVAAQAFKSKALAAAGATMHQLPDRELLFSWPTSRLSPADYATRFQPKSTARRPPKSASLVWREISAPLA